MDPLQWMGAVRMRVQTANVNISNSQVIHTIPVHQLMSCEVKSCMLSCVWNIVMFLSAVWTLILTAPIQDPLVSKWWNAKFTQIHSDKESNTFTIEWPNGKYIYRKFSIWLKFSFKDILIYCCMKNIFGL